MTAGVAHSETRPADVAVLRCQGCGARNPVRAPARIHGWQRCSRCGSVNVAPWSLAEAFDGPLARSVVLQRRGRAHFIVPRRTLLSTPELAAWLFLCALLGGFGMGLFELPPQPSGAWRWLGPLWVALAALSLAAWLAARWASVQHLEISPRRMRAYRSLGGHRFGLRERSLGERSLEATAGTSAWDDDSLRQRWRLELRPVGDARAPLRLVVEGEAEARWLAELARLAADPERAGRARCCGCGAPLDVDLERHAAGSIDCPYCQAGFVVSARQLAWPPVEIPEADETGLRESPHVERRCLDGGLRWELLPRQRVARTAHAFGMLYGVALFAGLGGFMIAVTPHMPAGAIGLRLYGLCGGLMLLGVAGCFLGMIALSLFGRGVLELDEASFRAAARLGRLRWARPEPAERGRPGFPRPSTGVPLVRLTGVELCRENGATALILTTPNRRLVTRWSLPPGEDRWLRREILDGLAARLPPLGRPVRRTDGRA